MRLSPNPPARLSRLEYGFFGRLLVPSFDKGFAMKPLLAVSVAVALFSVAAAAAPPRPAAELPRSFEGVVKAIKGRVVVLDSDRTFSTGGQTQYLLESGRDPQVVTRAALKVGVEVQVTTTVEGGETVADMVFIRRHSLIPRWVPDEG